MPLRVFSIGGLREFSRGALRCFLVESRLAVTRSCPVPSAAISIRKAPQHPSTGQHTTSPTSTSPASERSCHFGSSDETVYWSHEPFDTFQHRVVDLCRTVLSQENPTLERLKGGSWNLVIGILLPGGERYILRIHRYERGQMCYDIAPSLLLRQHPAIPAPTLIMSDISQENALGRSYMIQGWIPGQPLLYTYPGLPQWVKCAITQNNVRVSYDYWAL